MSGALFKGRLHHRMERHLEQGRAKQDEQSKGRRRWSTAAVENRGLFGQHRHRASVSDARYMYTSLVLCPLSEFPERIPKPHATDRTASHAYTGDW